MYFVFGLVLLLQLIARTCYILTEVRRIQETENNDFFMDVNNIKKSYYACII